MVAFGKTKYANVDVAILLATYNGEKFLANQLDSIEKQTYQNFVCFIHDDGSTDDTVAIIEKYCREHPEHFVYLGNDRCGGAKQNFMYMLQVVEADYIMFCDQDDYWADFKIEKSVSEIKKLENKTGGKKPCCVYSDVKVVDGNLKIVADSYFDFMNQNGEDHATLDLLKNNVVIGGTMMINKSLREQALNVKNINHIFMHDWWCALICSIMGEFCFINEPLSYYRQHGDNVVGAPGELKSYEKIKKMFSFRSWINEKRDWRDRPRNFAKELINVIPEDCDCYSFLKELSGMERKNKVQRIAFYRKNDLFAKNRNRMVQLLFV